MHFLKQACFTIVLTLIALAQAAVVSRPSLILNPKPSDLATTTSPTNNSDHKSVLSLSLKCFKSDHHKVVSNDLRGALSPGTFMTLLWRSFSVLTDKTLTRKISSPATLQPQNTFTTSSKPMEMGRYRLVSSFTGSTKQWKSPSTTVLA